MRRRLWNALIDLVLVLFSVQCWIGFEASIKMQHIVRLNASWSRGCIERASSTLLHHIFSISAETVIITALPALSLTSRLSTARYSLPPTQSGSCQLRNPYFFGASTSFYLACPRDCLHRRAYLRPARNLFADPRTHPDAKSIPRHSSQFGPPPILRRSKRVNRPKTKILYGSGVKQ